MKPSAFWLCLACWMLSPSLGCDGCSSSDREEQATPVGVTVGVSIDGQARPPIDTALFRTRPPDFEDGDHRGWRLESLVQGYEPGKMTVELEESDGARYLLARPADTKERIVVVAVNRAGALRVALVSPEEPFPPFHGRGGNRGRQGDPSRVKDVKRILLHAAP